MSVRLALSWQEQRRMRTEVTGPSNTEVRAPSFQGLPCHRGHSGLRYISNRQCVHCARALAIGRIVKARRKFDSVWARLRKRKAMRSTLASALSMDWTTINKWPCVPLKHVFVVARIVGVKPEILRPDFFADDPLRAAVLTQR